MKKEVKNNITGYKKLFGLMVICSLTPACTGLNYVSNKGVSELQSQYSLNLVKDDGYGIPKNFGAFMIPSSDPENEDPMIFLLKREKSKYYAQTMIADFSDDKKSFIKQSYLDFGLDSKSKGLQTKLTFKF